MNNSTKTYTVCQWISEVYKGPLPKEFVNVMKLTDENIKYFDELGFVDPTYENLHPACMGTIVDLCTRVIICEGRYWNPMGTITKGFYGLEEILEKSRIWEKGEGGIKYDKKVYERCIKNDLVKLEKLRAEIIENRGVLTREITILICELIRYNNFFRAGFRAFKEDVIEPTEQTVDNIMKMAERSAKFLNKFGCIRCGLYFNFHAFRNTKHIKRGDGDYWSEDIFFDMKVKKDKYVRADDIKQQVIYYLLSKEEMYDKYKFKKCIMFNPRYGSYYELNIDDIPLEMIEDIKSKW